MRRIAWLLLICGCASGSGLTLAPVPTPVPTLRPEGRVVLGDFSRVTALASASDRLYVMYPSALAVYRPLERRWDAPRNSPDPVLMRQVTLAIVDPIDRSVWLSAGTTWMHYDPITDRWDRGPLGGRATSIAFDPAKPGSGIWFLLQTGWALLPRGGVIHTQPPPRGLHSAEVVEDALRDVPQLRALAPRLLTGPRLGQGTFSAAAPDPSGRGWYLGSTNRGLLFFDRTATDVQPMSVGLHGDVVGALTLGSNGVWVATDAGVRNPSAIDFVAHDLNRSDPLSVPSAVGPPFDAVRAMLPVGDAIWLATDKGLMRAPMDGGHIDKWDVTRGLPDTRVISVAEFHGDIAAGTTRGLALVQPDGRVVRRAFDFSEPIYSLLSRGDTLWVGTSKGLFATLRTDSSVRMPEGYRQLSGSITAIYGIGYVGDTLVTMTADQLFWRNPHSGIWTAGPMLSAQLGSLRAFQFTAGGVWVGGSRGAGFVRPTTAVLRLILAPLDLPDAVTAIASTSRYLWIGTSSGLVRLLLEDR